MIQDSLICHVMSNVVHDIAWLVTSLQWQSDSSGPSYHLTMTLTTWTHCHPSPVQVPVFRAWHMCPCSPWHWEHRLPVLSVCDTVAQSVISWNGYDINDQQSVLRNRLIEQCLDLPSNHYTIINLMSLCLEIWIIEMALYDMTFIIVTMCAARLQLCTLVTMKILEIWQQWPVLVCTR